MLNFLTGLGITSSEELVWWESKNKATVKRQQRKKWEEFII